MKSFWLKTLSLLALPLLFVGSAVADEYADNNVYYNYNNNEDNGHHNLGCGSFKVWADVLAWTACQDLPVAFSIAGTIDEKKYFQDFDWRAGYRVGVGFAPACSGWKFDAYYTHFFTRSKVDRAPPAGGALFTYQPGGATTGFIPTLLADSVLTLDSRVELQYDSIDFEAAHPFWICDFMVSPFLGVRVVELREDVFEDNSVAVGDVVATKYAEKLKYWGAGLRGGLGWMYPFCHNFKVFGKFGGAVLVGEQRDKFKSSTNIGVVFEGSEKVKCHPLYNFDVALGLGYDLDTCWSWCPVVNFHVLYEFNYFANVINPYRGSANIVIGAGPTSGLALHGVTIGAGIKF